MTCTGCAASGGRRGGARHCRRVQCSAWPRPFPGRIDICAKRDTPVRSIGPRAVAAARDRGWVAGRFGVVGPAHERYYYAHLEDWREGLAEGEAVSEGSVLGYCATVGAPPCVGPVSAGTWPPPRPANQFSEQFRPGREPARAASLRADRARGPACATPLLADPDTCA